MTQDNQGKEANPFHPKVHVREETLSSLSTAGTVPKYGRHQGSSPGGSLTQGRSHLRISKRFTSQGKSSLRTGEQKNRSCKTPATNQILRTTGKGATERNISEVLLAKSGGGGQNSAREKKVVDGGLPWRSLVFRGKGTLRDRKGTASCVNQVLKTRLHTGGERPHLSQKEEKRYLRPRFPRG